MRDFILLCMMALLFTAGYQSAKKADVFFSNLHKLSDKTAPGNTLKIAFEYPEDASSIREIMEQVEHRNSGSRFCFFYGTFEEIDKHIECGDIDIGLLNDCRPVAENRNLHYRKTELTKQTLIFRDLYVPVQPIHAEAAGRILVWRDRNPNQILPVFLKCLDTCSSKRVEVTEELRYSTYRTGGK